VPNDSTQASVMVEIFLALNVKCAFGIYSNNQYGIGANDQLEILTLKEKINYSSIKIDNNYAEVFKAVNSSDSDYVCAFMNLNDINDFFKYLSDNKIKTKPKLYISGDGWVKLI
jgi:ABC-type branched-subunit amino acid transport system substrate-binding protein